MLLNRVHKVGFFAFSAVAAGFGFAACSDDATTTPTANDAGPDGSTPEVNVSNDTETKQSGKIVRAQTEGTEAVGGATVTVGSATATTNANGEYEIIVPRNTPYQMTVAAEGYYKLTEQEWIVKQPAFARGDTDLLLTATANILAGILPGRKTELGFLVVKINPQAPCESEEGSTVDIEPKGEAIVSYFGGSLPDSAQPYAKKGTTFSAAIYNIQPGVPVKVTVTSPLCEQVPFPIDLGDVTYTGVQKTEGGEALSYLRTYIRDPKAANGDAGVEDAGGEAGTK